MKTVTYLNPSEGSSTRKINMLYKGCKAAYWHA